MGGHSTVNHLGPFDIADEQTLVGSSLAPHLQSGAYPQTGTETPSNDVLQAGQ